MSHATGWCGQEGTRGCSRALNEETRVKNEELLRTVQCLSGTRWKVETEEDHQFVFCGVLPGRFGPTFDTEDPCGALEQQDG
ncbi:hypothetical protein ACOSP7_011003 [Xanthoceras sorbifolium]